MLDQFVPCHPNTNHGVYHDGSVGLESRYDYAADQKKGSKSDYHENFFHDVKKIAKIQKRKQVAKGLGVLGCWGWEVWDLEVRR